MDAGVTPASQASCGCAKYERGELEASCYRCTQRPAVILCKLPIVFDQRTNVASAKRLASIKGRAVQSSVRRLPTGITFTVVYAGVCYCTGRTKKVAPNHFLIITHQFHVIFENNICWTFILTYIRQGLLGYG